MNSTRADHQFTDGITTENFTTKAPIPEWSHIMDKIQLALTFIGFFANLLSFITLLKNGKSFQTNILLLLRHQAFIDMLACLSGALLMILPHMWLTGAYALDIIICQGWHGQAIYWAIMWVSIWNLIGIAYERYLAVCRPFHHQDFTRRKVWITILSGYPLSLAFTFGAYLQTKLIDGVCVSEFFFSGKFGKDLMMGFAFSTFFSFYAIPVIMFTIFYGMVVFTLRKRSQQFQLANSRVIDSATTELTRTAIAVTLIFIVTIGYDLWYYMLGYTGVADYKVNSPVQRIGILFATCNSVANPFVYAMLMPAYRKSVMLTLCCKNNTRDAKETSNETASTSAV